MSGLETIRAIQSVHSPLLDRFFGIMTDLHHADFYLVVFPLLLWLYDKRFTRYLVSVFLLGYWVNGMLKTSFYSSRPPADAVRKLYEASASGPAFPSGHAQSPIMFWGAIALQFGKKWITVLCGLIIFLVGYSRLYGGLHWPIDIVGGWVIGLLMLIVFERTRGFWLGEGMGMRAQLLVAVAIPLATLLIWKSAAWDSSLSEAGDSWKLGGAYIGFWVGSILEDEYVGFDPRAGGWLAQLVKIAVGVGMVLALRVGLKAALPAVALSDFLRYMLITFTASFIAPWIFSRFVVSPPAGRTVRQQHNL